MHQAAGFRRVAVVLVANVVVFCVAAEMLALAIFYYEHGWLFYLDPYRPTIAPIQQDGGGDALTAVGLHPYFGPTHRPGISFDLPPELRSGEADQPMATNNFGFPARVNYPFLKTSERQFVIGIFGGSVGAYFCRIGAARLEERLRRDSSFANRELVTLCFSHEGYKQPQQLLVLNYFLSIGQAFDLVINIDGFNEVTLGRINDQHGWDISMPSHEHLDGLINLVNQATLTPAKVAALARIVDYREQLNAIAQRSNATSSAAVEFVLRHYHGFVRSRYERERVRFEQLPSNLPANSPIHVTPKVRERRGDTVYEDIAANWRAASVLMQQLLAARRVSYLHVLQPNQYYSTRTFSAPERAVAFNEGSPFREGAAQGYPFLEKALEAGALNAVHLFDTAPEAVYVDDCCHYTVAGNRVLADFIANAVLTTGGARSATH